MQRSEIYRLITHDDVKARTKFIHDFKTELKDLSSIFSEAFMLLDNSDCVKDDSNRADIVSSYLYLTIESAVTAVQLLSLGHIAPAGNSMRISYESLCMAALLKKKVKVQVANGNHLFHFYEEYKNKSSLARADKALNLAIKNHKILGLNKEGADFLKRAKNFYNGYSHAGLLFVHSKIKPSTRQFYIGGGYDTERKTVFQKQIKFIVRYSNSLTGWIKAVAYNAS